MNLGELISELRRNILYDRSDRSEGDSDLLWDDDTLTRYIDEAQRKLAREGLVIRDSRNSTVCQITLVAGQAEYPLHESVIAVVSARYDTDQGDLKRVGHSFISGYIKPYDDYFDVNAAATLTPGRPIAFSTDESVRADENDSMGVVNLKLFPTPTADEAGKIVYLRVVRLPIERLSKKQLRAVPEVPEAYHLSMLDYAAYLCLRVQDQDAGNRSAASDFEARFGVTVKTARRDAMRKMFTPQRWGFGNSGWSWEK